MIRVLMADEHDIVRIGLRRLLEQAGDIQVVGEAADGQQALDLTVQLSPDLLLLGISMPGMNGIEVLRHLSPLGLPTRVVMVSMHADAAHVQAALANGAKGYVVKTSVVTELMPTVRAASRGETYLSPAIADVVVNQLLGSKQTSQGPAGDLLNPLTARSRAVLRLLALGHINKTIAQRMRISPRTIEKHRASLMQKLNATDLATLVQITNQAGLAGPHQ